LDFHDNSQETPLMNHWTRRIPFQVDVAGVIHIMGTSLYSRADVALRELLQNAHDAIMRRRQTDLQYQGRIDIVQDAAQGTLSVTDDGVGLTSEEAEKYLGTLGIGVTGLLRGRHPAAAQAGSPERDSTLIGQFGIGLFSAFMLADRLLVETRRLDCTEGVRWAAGDGPDIELSACDRTTAGTTVTLFLKDEFLRFARDREPVEGAIKEYADYLPIPVFLNHEKARLNVIDAAWFHATPDPDSIELALEAAFHETPLDVIPIRADRPVSISGALYVTPQRMPGFAGEPVVTTLVRRMVISRHQQGLLPDWAPFVRGVLELNQCEPTASREDLVRNAAFERTRAAIEEHLFAHFERLGREDPPRLNGILSWHKYTWAGAGLANRRLRDLLRGAYQFNTSSGPLTYDAIHETSRKSPLFDSEFDSVIWYNSDRRQERWINSLFADAQLVCVHAWRAFEESLLAAMAGDGVNEGGDGQGTTDLRIASPSDPGFAAQVLGARDVEEAPADWQKFLSAADVRVLTGNVASEQPVLAFLNERHELLRTLDDLKKEGQVPAGFQRLMDRHFEGEQPRKNEVLLNRGHPLVATALAQSTRAPLASVVRLLVVQALTAAGAAPARGAQQQLAEDLEWLGQCLKGRST
jgi:HSP90 family molecular chaperone